MKLLKWLSVTDRFAKTYLDSKLAPLGINSSQHMYLLKLCDQPGIHWDTKKSQSFCEVLLSPALQRPWSALSIIL